MKFIAFSFWKNEIPHSSLLHLCHMQIVMENRKEERHRIGSIERKLVEANGARP